MSTENIIRAPRSLIGRAFSVAVLGNTDREHPIEDEIAAAVHEAGERHGFDILVSSGPYYSDGDEQTRELAKSTVERDRLRAALKLVLLNGHPEPEVLDVVRKALAPATPTA